jgi:hypothetical protein
VFGRDFVAAGFIKDIDVAGRRVTIHFAPNRRNQAMVEQMETDNPGSQFASTYPSGDSRC